MNRQPRIRFSALRAKQSKNEVRIFQDNVDNKPKYGQNQAVFVRNFGKGARWIPGIIIKIISPRNYEVQVGDVVWKRHEEQLRPRYIPQNTDQPQNDSRMRREERIQIPEEIEHRSQLTPSPSVPETPAVPDSNVELTSPPKDPIVPGTQEETSASNDVPDLVTTPVENTSKKLVRKDPKRDRKPPQRFY